MMPGQSMDVWLNLLVHCHHYIVALYNKKVIIHPCVLRTLSKNSQASKIKPVFLTWWLFLSCQLININAVM